MRKNVNSGRSTLSTDAVRIMTALADGEKHGFAIVQHVGRQTGGRRILGPGALYGTIKRLLAAGLIEPTGERPDPALGAEPRRHYRLSAAGFAVVPAAERRIPEGARVVAARAGIPA
jgi:DNA-binding PadR family transcriptional regulator